MRALQTTLLVLFLVLVTACGAQDVADEPTAAVSATTEATPTQATMATEPPATETPTLEPTPTLALETPTSEPAAETPATTAETFCPEVARPALIAFIPGEKYVVSSPLTGQSCALPFPEPLPETLQAAGEKLYYHVAEGDNLIVQRLSPDGTTQLLPVTAVNVAASGLFQNFIVSDDARLIAWSNTRTKPDEPTTVISELWVADIESGQITAQLSDLSGGEEGPRALVPVRFSEDLSTLFYARQPVGIGGSWVSFVGRYHSLFSTPANGGEVTPIFDCNSQGLFLCIGDFYDFQGQASTIAYVDDSEKSVVVLNQEGRVINTLPVGAEYVGYTTFGPSAELVFYSADLSEDGPFPEQASLSRVAPPTAPAETVASNPKLALPQFFLDDTRVITSYVNDNGGWGLAVVDLMSGTLQPIPGLSNAIAVDVLTAFPQS